MDLGFDGYQFTWARGRCSVNWVEEKLDRVLVSRSWHELFNHALASSLTISNSDHLPIMLIPKLMEKRLWVRKFRFENIWLQDEQYRHIIETS